VSDQTSSPQQPSSSSITVEPAPQFDGFNEDGSYTPREIVANDLDAAALEDAYASSMVDVEDGQLVTGHARQSVAVQGGRVEPDPARDLLLLAVVNRYIDAPPALALVRGIGLRRGAIASSVAHDSHNVVAVGASRSELADAVNAVCAARGGLALAGSWTHVLELPIAGLMSDRPSEEVAATYARLTEGARALGSPLHAPFMTLAFLALIVIPALKLSDRGLVDALAMNLIPPVE
jgi:adenine deaminase